MNISIHIVNLKDRVVTILENGEGNTLGRFLADVYLWIHNLQYERDYTLSSDTFSVNGYLGLPIRILIKEKADYIDFVLRFGK